MQHSCLATTFGAEHASHAMAVTAPGEQCELQPAVQTLNPLVAPCRGRPAPRVCDAIRTGPRWESQRSLPRGRPAQQRSNRFPISPDGEYSQSPSGVNQGPLCHTSAATTWPFRLAKTAPRLCRLGSALRVWRQLRHRLDAIWPDPPKFKGRPTASQGPRKSDPYKGAHGSRWQNLHDIDPTDFRSSSQFE